LRRFNRQFSLVGCFPCRLEDNATPYLDGVVCEAFVEATQQGDMNMAANSAV
jgi:hypothetical protein